MMKYCTLSYSQSDNLGDEIQSLAAEQYLPTFDGFVDRDKGLHAVTEPTFIFMNGWFKHGPNHWRNDASHCWPPAPSVHPAFIGFHIAYPDLLADEFVEYYRRWAPIGCRDQGTVDMLREKRIDAHLTRCLTLTFPPREAEPANGGVYIVEGMERIPRETIRPELADGAQYRNHYGRYMDRFSNGD